METIEQIIQQCEILESRTADIAKFLRMMANWCDGLKDNIELIKPYWRKEEQKQAEKILEEQNDSDYVYANPNQRENEIDSLFDDVEFYNLGTNIYGGNEAKMRENYLELEELKQKIIDGKAQLKTGNQRWVYELTIESLMKPLDKKIQPHEIYDNVMGISKTTYYKIVKEIETILPWTKGLIKREPTTNKRSDS